MGQLAERGLPTMRMGGASFFLCRLGAERGLKRMAGRSRMTGDCHVRFFEGLGGKFPWPTRLKKIDRAIAGPSRLPRVLKDFCNRLIFGRKQRKSVGRISFCKSSPLLHLKTTPYGDSSTPLVNGKLLALPLQLCNDNPPMIPAIGLPRQICLQFCHHYSAF